MEWKNLTSSTKFCDENTNVWPAASPLGMHITGGQAFYSLFYHCYIQRLLLLVPKKHPMKSF